MTAAWGIGQRNGLFRAYSKFQRDNDLAPFIEAIKTFYAGIPYQWEKDNRNEHYYHALLYMLPTSFGAVVRAEEPTAKGQTDLTLLMPKGIYVMEIKYERLRERQRVGASVGMGELSSGIHTAQKALDQINSKGYAEAAPVAVSGLCITCTLIRGV